MEQKQYDVLCGFMEHLTKDYNWYYDTPERRFEYSPKSIWLINPETREWVIELKKEGNLWWYWDFHFNFKRYFNMEHSEYEKFIKVWVEDVLNRGVSSTMPSGPSFGFQVEDVLNRGVSSTMPATTSRWAAMEDVLNRGITTNGKSRWKLWEWMKNVLNHGKKIQ